MQEFKRTYYSKRGDFEWRFVDGTKVKIQVGTEGVTAEDIKKLHSLDDSIVYNNLKNCSRVVENEKYTDEREFGEELTEESFKKERKTKRIWHTAFNAFAGDDEISEDKSWIMAQACEIDGKTEEIPERILALREMIDEHCTEKQKTLFRILYIEGNSQTYAAQILGISDVAVHKLKKKILDKIRTYYPIEKFPF